MALNIRQDPQAHCTFLRQFTYELEWLPERHYVPGTQVELRSGCLRSFHDWRHIRIEIEKADITFRWKVNPSVSDMWTNRERVIVRARLPYGVRRGEPVRIHITAVPSLWAGINEKLSVWTIDIPNNFKPPAEQQLTAEKEAGSECELHVVAGAVERFSVYCHPMPDADGRVRTCLIPEDRFGNPAIFEQPVGVRLEWLGQTWTQQIQEATILHLEGPQETARLQASIPMAALAPSENIANGLRRDGELMVIGNPVWPGPVGNLRAAFGEFHWHTEFSGDGQRPITEALRCARDYLNMDYAAPADHNTRGENWTRTVEALDAYNAPDAFATFYGWENGTDRGHENYYFIDPNHPLVCGGSAGFTGGHTSEVIDRLLPYTGFFGVPHHTNAVAESRKLEDDSPYWHPYPWMEPVPYLRLIEIMQCRGNQERDIYTDTWRGWHQNNHASAQDALALGHKLGFTGGTDNHCGWPGRAYAQEEAGPTHTPKSVILTGLWTPRVERQSIYDSLWQRHTWAVWDTRAIVRWELNEALMGDEIEVEKGTALLGHLCLSAEDALQSVEIISDGETVWISSFQELDVDIQIPLGTAEHSTHFYVRALQRNGGIIYASPVFVTIREK